MFEGKDFWIAWAFVTVGIFVSIAVCISVANISQFWLLLGLLPLSIPFAKDK